MSATAVLPSPADPGRAQARLVLFLLLAPALVWLLGLIVLPHIDLAVLSLRERIAPRQYAPSIAQQVAELRGISVDALEAATTANARHALPKMAALLA